MSRKLKTASIILFGTVMIFFSIFLISEYKSAEIPKSQCKKIEGTLTGVTEGGIKDVAFTLAENRTCYYINRGLENRFNLKDLQKLVGKKATIFYSDHTNFLSGENPSKHIRELYIGNEVFYSVF